MQKGKPISFMSKSIGPKVAALSVMQSCHGLTCTHRLCAGCSVTNTHRLCACCSVNRVYGLCPLCVNTAHRLCAELIGMLQYVCSYLQVDLVRFAGHELARVVAQFEFEMLQD